MNAAPSSAASAEFPAEITAAVADGAAIDHAAIDELLKQAGSDDAPGIAADADVTDPNTLANAAATAARCSTLNTWRSVSGDIRISARAYALSAAIEDVAARGSRRISMRSSSTRNVLR